MFCIICIFCILYIRLRIRQLGDSIQFDSTTQFNSIERELLPRTLVERCAVGERHSFRADPSELKRRIELYSRIELDRRTELYRDKIGNIGDDKYIKYTKFTNTTKYELCNLYIFWGIWHFLYFWRELISGAHSHQGGGTAPHRTAPHRTDFF